MTFKAEAVGLLLALHLLSLERNACSTTILLDNQAVIQSLEHHKTKSAQYLLDELAHQIGMIHRQVRHPDFELSIAWVKGHIEIEGNELANTAAKVAAGGESSPASSLPHMLTSPLPVSITAQKQAFMASLHKQWGEGWRQSPQYSRLSKIDPSLPSNKYRKLTLELSRAQSSIVMQLQLGHVPLNAYLHRISKLDLPTCALCVLSGQQ